MKTEKYLLYILIVITLIGCNPDIFNLKTKAYFDYSPSKDIKTTDTIKFSNCSENSNYYYWNFGDGTTSIENSPLHIYKSSGSYNVKLIASNESKSDSTSKIINIDDIVSLNDTIVSQNSVSIDVDGDGMVDFKLQAYVSGGTTIQAQAEIYSLNNYEIFCDSIIQTLREKTWNSALQAYDTVTSTKNVIVPKIYIFGDNIQNSNMIVKNSLTFCYTYSDRFYTWYWYNGWIKDEIRYIGFRKLYGNVIKIGWIKLKISDYTNVVLYSFKIPIETNSLLIDK